eukprot:PhF_6_TR20466/c0_g1_i1/m.29433
MFQKFRRHILAISGSACCLAAGIITYSNPDIRFYLSNRITYFPTSNPTDVDDGNIPLTPFHVFCRSVGIDFMEFPYLNSNFVVSDVSLPGEPIVFASNEFCEMTGYSQQEIVGKNCRFLQGQGTDRKSVEAIRHLIRTKTSGFVHVLNFTKQGVPFENMLYLCPIGDRYFIGCQCATFRTKKGNDVKSQPVATSGIQKSNLQVTECLSQVKIVPNDEPATFETSLLKGSCYIKTATHPYLDSRVASYFTAERPNKYEIQFQFMMKQPMENHTLILASYLDKPMEGNSKATQWTVRMLASLFESIGPPGTAITYGTENVGCKPGFAGPLVTVCDRFVVGDTPTVLGLQPFPQSSSSSNSVDNNTIMILPNKRYAFSFQSKFVDFERWLVIDVPGISSIPLQTFWGKQSLRFGLFAMPLGLPTNQVYSKGTKLFELNIAHQGI